MLNETYIKVMKVRDLNRRLNLKEQYDRRNLTEIAVIQKNVLRDNLEEVIKIYKAADFKIHGNRLKTMTRNHVTILGKSVTVVMMVICKYEKEATFNSRKLKDLHIEENNVYKQQFLL